jgi:hypothetical protein
LYITSAIQINNEEKKMSDLPDGLDDSAMVAAIAWEIVNFAYLRTAYFNERPNDETLAKLTNEFIRVRQAIYHGKYLSEPEK